MTDFPDAIGFSLLKKKPSSGPSRKRPEVDFKSDCYNFENLRRGNAIIFNHYEFDKSLQLEKRNGTMKDAKDLEDVLKDLKFDVTTYNDLKFAGIYDILTNLSKADHSNADCLLIAVLSHGNTGKIFAQDHQYPADALWQPFAGDQCLTLVGKPKLFFIQACRGDEVDDGVKVRTVQADSKTINTTIPVMADILIMYSCFHGYMSWRCSDSGTWFIQCLCTELKLRAKKNDLLTILTFLNRRMAFYYKSIAPGDEKKNNKKQIGTIISTLTRLLYFYPAVSGGK